MKNFFLGLLFSFCPLLCIAASFEALTDEDAGVLLYYYNNSSVLVFRKRVADGNDVKLWECTRFRGNDQVLRVRPNSCNILSYTEDELTTGIVAIELAYWTSQNDHNRTTWYRQIAEKMNDPETNNLLSFYAALKNHVGRIQREIADYQKAVSTARSSAETPAASYGSNSQNQTSGSAGSAGSTGSIDVLEEGLRAIVQNSDLVDQFQKIAKDKKNFFLALCMYLRYREATKTALRGVSPTIVRSLLDEIDRQGDVIRQEF